MLVQPNGRNKTPQRSWKPLGGHGAQSMMKVQTLHLFLNYIGLHLFVDDASIEGGASCHIVGGQGV